MSLRIRFEGLKEYESALRRAPEAVRHTTHRMIEEVGQEINKEARRRVHVVTGRLRASIRVRKQGEFKLRVEATAPYAAIEEARVGGSRGPGPHAYMAPAVGRAKLKLRQEWLEGFWRLVMRKAR